MIKSADEFLMLLNSESQEGYFKTGREEASDLIWLEIIENHEEARVWVARNRTISDKVIMRLIMDNDPIVRDAITGKYPLSREAYLALSQDPDEGIRSRLLFNKKIPIDILKKIAVDDESEFVRKQAQERLDRESLNDGSINKKAKIR